MNKSRFIVASLGTATTVIAPLATLVACGNNEPHKPVTPTVAPTKTSVALKDVALTEYDVERNILNTEEFGFLPLTRILHTLESKDFGTNVTNQQLNMDLTNIGRSIENKGITKVTSVKDVDLKNADLIEQAKIYIDSSVQMNGKTQSLENPIKSFNITKKDILSDASAYANIAKQVSEFLTKNKNNKYSVLTTDTIEDTADTNGEFKSGTYTINIYQKPANSADLDKAIGILRDSSKFGSNEFALKMMDGFSLGYVQQYSGNWWYSLISNYIYASGASLIEAKDFTDGKLPNIFNQANLTKAAYDKYFKNNFTKTEPVSGASLAQVGSINISETEHDFFANKTVQIGNLVVDKKNNEMALELTLTAVPNAKITTHATANNGVPFTKEELAANYEQGSVETIYIDLPKHTSWISGTASSVMDELFEGIKTKVNTPKLYEAFINLFEKAQVPVMGIEPLNSQDLVGPHLKNILLDDATWFEKAAKYVDVLNNRKAFEDFINWAEKTNSAFSAATLNQSIKNFDGLPSTISLELNSSKLYTFFGFVPIFYKELDMFMNSAEGKQYQNLLNVSSVQEQLEKANTDAYAKEKAEIKTNFDGKSFDLNRMLPETAKDIKTVLSAIKFPADTVNLKAEVTKIDIDSINGTGKVEITLTPLKLKNQASEVIKFDLTNIIKDSEINAKRSELATLINPIKLSSTQFKIFVPAGLAAMMDPQLVPKTLNFKFGFTGNYDDNLKVLKGGLELPANYLNIIIGQTEFDKLDLTTKTPTGTEFMFKAQNVDVTNGTFDLLVGLRDVATKVTTYGSDALKISK